MPTAYLKQMARLMSIHKATHPARIARRFGVTEDYVRQLGDRYQPGELAPTGEALEVLYGKLSKTPLLEV